MDAYSSLHRELIAFPECETHDVCAYDSDEYQKDDGSSEK
jgi:hypothetical protein